MNAKEISAITIWLGSRVDYEDFNKKSMILKEIMWPEYGGLKTLILGDNNINSLEYLTFLKASKLEKLFLSSNWWN
jgi:hypothetical protein